MTAAWSAGRETTALSLLRERLESDPDGEYLDVTGTKFSAAAVARLGRVIANALVGLGVQRGDRVAILLENSPEIMLSWWGILHAGAIAVPVNTAYKGEYLRHQLADSGTRVVVVARSLVDRVARVVEGLPELAHVVIVDDAGPGGPATIPMLGHCVVHPWVELVSGDDRELDVRVDPHDLATFVYTGGTTGPSKGCMLSHNYHGAAAYQIGWILQRTPDDVLWTPLPLFHYNAILTAVLGPLLCGGRSGISRRFSVSGFWPEINRVGATISMTLGTMCYLLAGDVERPEMPRSGAPEANTTLRTVTGAPMSVDVAARLRDRFGVDTFSGGYGLTEATMLALLPPGIENRPDAAGVVNDRFFDVRVFDDHDHELPRGTSGEIVVRPKQPHVMFEGYWGRPEATVDTTRNLWFHTGDIGRVDDDGFLYFLDRKADYLRRRGENISSQEVEKVLMAHDGLVEVAVHAVASELSEDDLKVTAVRQPDATVTEEDLFRWCIEELPYFALPRYIEFRDALPRSPVGQVLKRELRAEGATATTWDVEQAAIPYERR